MISSLWLKRRKAAKQAQKLKKQIINLFSFITALPRNQLTRRI